MVTAHDKHDSSMRRKAFIYAAGTKVFFVY